MEVKRQLSQEEHEKVARGESALNLDDTSPSAFLITSLEIEETQYVKFTPQKLKYAHTGQAAASSRHKEHFQNYDTAEADEPTQKNSKILQCSISIHAMFDADSRSRYIKA